MTQPVPTKTFLQPAKAAAMCTAPHAENLPPPPIPPFLLVQNLSSKQIVPTDYMWPRLHDEYARHQWLKIQKNVVELSRTLVNAWGEYLFSDAERYETDATVMSQNYPVVFEFHSPLQVNKMSIIK